jgi:hypothetical protein
MVQQKGFVRAANRALFVFVAFFPSLGLPQPSVVPASLRSATVMVAKYYRL